VKLIVVGINYYPELTGIGVYTTEMCEYLQGQGHQVTVFTGFPYYPEWKIKEEYRNKVFKTEVRMGVKLKRSYVYVPCKISAKTRILHEASFIISSFINLLFAKRADLMIVVSPPLGLGIAACIISQIRRIPFVFHIQDLQPDAAAELGMIKNKLVLKLLYGIEKFIYNSSSAVSVISGKMREKVISKGMDIKKIMLFPNWANTEQIKPMKRDNEFRTKNKLGNRFVVLYAGNIGMKQGLDVVLEMALKTAGNKNIIYVIAGDGAYRKELINNCEVLALSNVLFLPVQSKEVLPYMLAASDVCLIPQRRNITDIVMPSKLLGIMASGRPVVAGANQGSELYQVIKDSGCGIVVEPENAEKMMEAIMEIYNEPQKKEDFGRKAREYAVEHLNSKMILKSLEKEIVRLTKFC